MPHTIDLKKWIGFKTQHPGHTVLAVLSGISSWILHLRTRYTAWGASPHPGIWLSSFLFTTLATSIWNLRVLEEGTRCGRWPWSGWRVFRWEPCAVMVCGPPGRGAWRSGISSGPIINLVGDLGPYFLSRGLVFFLICKRI